MSSANSLTCDWIFSKRSFMKSKKSSGPSTEPWGTLDNTGTSEEHFSSSTTAWVWPPRKELIREWRV